MILNLIANEIYVQLNNYYSAIVLFLWSSNLILLNREEIMKVRSRCAKRENANFGNKRAIVYVNHENYILTHVIFFSYVREIFKQLCESFISLI